MIIDWRELTPEALNGVIEDFVTREGTDYGHQLATLEAKVKSVQRQLEVGTAVIVFDADAESCSILPAVDGLPK